MSGPGYLRATSVDEACRAVAADADQRRMMGGGTALVLMLRNGLIDLELLVDITRLPELAGIEVSGRELTLGSATTLSELAASPIVREHAPSLAAACSVVGNVRVRNAATIGGNLAEADYASDPPSVLVSLDARCTVQGPTGTRSLAVADLIVDHYTLSLEAGELITAVHVPLGTAATRRSAYLRHTTRSTEDRPAVGVAARVDLDAEARVEQLSVVVGAVSATPQRLPEVCAAASGRVLDADLAREVATGYAEAIDPIADPRASAWYRRRMIAVFVRRALEALAMQPGGGQHG